MNDMREAGRITGRYADIADRDYPYARADITREALAIVLAGGRGTRLSPLTDRRAKPAVPFGGAFRIIDFTLSNCLNSGVRRIGIATQYQARSLTDHVQRSWSFLDPRFNEFVALLPAHERSQARCYNGTADAVYQNLHLLRRYHPRVVLILAGDHIYKMDYARLIETHLDRDAPMSIVCTEVPSAQASQFGVMEVDSSERIVGFEEKPARPQVHANRPDTVLGSMGIYAVDPRFLAEQLEADAEDPQSDHDFGHTIIPRLIDAGHDVGAYRFVRDAASLGGGRQPYWRDVGTIDTYWKANMDLVEPQPELDLYDGKWPIWAAPEHLPPAKLVFDGRARRGLAADSLVSGGCVVEGSALRHSVLFPNVRVANGCEIDQTILLPNVELGGGTALRKVVVDKDVRIPPGLRAGYDRAADRQRFFVSDDGVTVITAAMLGSEQYRR